MTNHDRGKREAKSPENSLGMYIYGKSSEGLVPSNNLHSQLTNLDLEYLHITVDIG